MIRKDSRSRILIISGNARGARWGALAPAGAALLLGVLALLVPTALPAGEEKPKPPAKPAAAPAKAPAKPAPPVEATKSGTPSDSLSFTDDDLKKYHKPQPVADEATDEDEEPAPEPTDPSAPPTPGAANPATTKPAPPRPTAKKAPPYNPVLGPPPVPDPLNKWKQKDAIAGMRAQQIAALREKITGLKSRLEYLNAKKDGLLNPGPPQAASTRGNAYPPTQPPDPNKPPPPPNYKPDISPGRSIQPVGLIFPSLPEPQTDADREDDKTMKINDLLDKVKAEIESVEADLKKANDDLITIETRAAGEAAQP